ncbi:MAG TPA: protein kinase [Terriglobales bacterium]|nr:protein kinase [Terriglobales bacterium]
MIGQTISHYHITGQLGSGGMGVVYEAQDLTLGRRVALKFLPPELARDQGALDRFLLEARTASALNHPNICTIYAVENDSGQAFISMELLEGQSLDRKLGSGPLALNVLLDISIQLADALEAAHAKGIVHRDLKPANIFVTQRSQVKILDFGLAKLTRAAEMAMVETVVSSNPVHLTSPGSTVGTIAYMSPEQARGEELDARSDLFSFGTVIYQMSTGRLPFSGNTTAVIFNAILEHDPIPVTQLNPALPPKLQEIVERLLEKDRDLRYQSAADLRGELKRLKRDSSSGHKTRAVSGSVAEPVPALPPTATRISSSSAVVAAARQHKFGLGITGLLAILLAVAGAYGIYAFFSRGRTTAFQNFSVSKVTETGKARLVAISPDGKYILNVHEENGQQSLWLRNIATNSNTQVMPPEPLQYLGVRFSPDGNYLYFVRGELGQALHYLYRAPVLGGTPQKLVTDVDTNISFSPDGRSLVYTVQNNPEMGKFRLVVHSLDTGEGKTLVQGSLSQVIGDPAWSPDGKTIAGVILQPTQDALSGVVAIDVATGKQKLFSTIPFGLPSRLIWLPNGSGLLALSTDKETNFSRARIVEVSYPDGKVKSVTQDISDYADLSLAADGGTLATVLQQSQYDLYVAPASDLGSVQAEQIATHAPFMGFSWTKDGQIIMSQDFTLSLFDLQSHSKTPLTSTQQDGFAMMPSACSNGRYVVFMLAGHGGAKVQNIWRIDASGGNLKQVSDGKANVFAVCSSDGKTVFYLDMSGGAKLTKVSLDGGKSEPISEFPALGFDLSPDGKLAAFATFPSTSSPKEVLAVVAVDSPQSLKLSELQRPSQGAVRFMPDGKAVAYPFRDKDADNLWMQPLDGWPGKQTTNFNSERIADFHWSFDGSKLGLIRGHTDSDVVLIRDSRQ